jgi:hypothetical protein
MIPAEGRTRDGDRESALEHVAATRAAVDDEQRAQRFGGAGRLTKPLQETTIG